MPYVIPLSDPLRDLHTQAEDLECRSYPRQMRVLLKKRKIGNKKSLNTAYLKPNKIECRYK